MNRFHGVVSNFRYACRNMLTSENTKTSFGNINRICNTYRSCSKGVAPNPQVNSSDLNELTTEITKEDPALEKKLNILKLEVEVFRQDGSNVPSSLKTEHWMHLLQLNTRTARKKYLSFLFKSEMRDLNEKRKKEEKRRLREEFASKLENENISHIKYGFGGNTIFVRIYDTTMNDFYHSRLVQAMLFGQKLVIDCGYDCHMTEREAKNCAKQIMILFAQNRINDEPFDLQLCNVDKKGHTIRYLHKSIPTMYDPDFPLNISEGSYLDLFPKEKLVYLTPHCKEIMETFDSDAIYIVGGMVDKSNQTPLSLAKAKKEGLKMAKLPLDKYLVWNSGSGKSLTINSMVDILLELKASGDWNKAFKHVPKRKLIDKDNLSKYDEEDDIRIFRRKKMISRYEFQRPEYPIKNMY